MNTSLFFDAYYNNAKVNSIIIMDSDGIVLNVNGSFTDNFGYNNEDIKGLNFSILFTETDKRKNCPAIELEIVTANGNAPDENYIVHKNGTEIWATGESILVKDANGAAYIVKDIVNLQSKKHLKFLVSDADELLERIFKSSNEISVMILDGALRILKVNSAFLNLFEMAHTPEAGSTLSSLNHPFWNDALVKQELRNVIVKNTPLKNKRFLIDIKKAKKTITLNSKVVDKQGGEKQIFIIIQ